MIVKDFWITGLQDFLILRRISMLFCLDESILEVLNDESVKDAIANLTMSRKKGKHLIYGTRRVLDELSKSNELDKMQKDVFAKLISKISKMKSYLKEFNRRIELVANISTIKRYSDEYGSIIQMPIQFLEDFNLVTESMLILEDINDYKLYKFITNYVLDRRNITDVNFNFSVIPGAGGGIKKVFEEKISQNNHLVVSIVDTDKTSPGEGIHPTARPLITFYNRIKNACLGEVFFSEYHEVENLIPQFCYEELIGLSKNDIESYLEAAASTADKPTRDIPIDWRTYQLDTYKLNRKDVFKYFDYKKGIRVTNFRNVHGERFWSKLLLDIGSDFDIDKYKPIDDVNKEIIVIKGFNDKVLDNTYKLLAKANFNELDELLTKELKGLWYEIGNFLLDWGCGGIPMRVG
jgi:hypothetical protein